MNGCAFQLRPFFSRRCSTFISACEWYELSKFRTGEKFDFSKSSSSKIQLKKPATTDLIWSNVSKRAQAYTPSTLPRVRNPDPCDFYVNFISKGLPVVVEGLLESSLAFRKWNEEYLRTAMKGQEVTVCVTPNGIVDEIYNNLLVRPQRTRLPYTTFSDIVFDRPQAVSREGVYYVQDQASNLSGEFAPIASDVSERLEISKFLSVNPIRNVWIGQSGSHSSLHFDFYENFHCLISGTKKWTLLHPTDLPFLYLNYWAQAEWRFVTPQEDSSLTQSEWRIVRYSRSNLDQQKFPWLQINPDDFDEVEFPRAANCNPVHYLQQPGETLFIPTGWHHQVTTGASPSMAVNYWHEPHNPNVANNIFLMAQLDRYARENEHRAS